MVAGKEADEKCASSQLVYVAYRIVGEQEFERCGGWVGVGALYLV